jgi:hypothetical protein
MWGRENYASLLDQLDRHPEAAKLAPKPRRSGNGASRAGRSTQHQHGQSLETGDGLPSSTGSVGRTGIDLRCSN